MPVNPNKQGKKPLLFKQPLGEYKNLYESIQVPCGKCISCRKQKALRDATQLYCELRTTELPSYFITLTIDDDNLNESFSVDKKDLQKFTQDIRDYQRSKNGTATLRYKTKGEYGGKFKRPHYHQAAFGLEIPDLEIWSIKNAGTPQEYKIYTSPLITEIWGKGMITLNELCMPNCIYISNHHLDEKILNPRPDHLTPVQHPVSHKLILTRQPEFTLQSNKPSLGRKFYEEFFTDIYPHDYIVINGQKCPVPKVFDKWLSDENPTMYEEITERRKAKISRETQERYDQKEAYKNAVLKREQK